jgi:hypothetical protein
MFPVKHQPQLTTIARFFISHWQPLGAGEHLSARARHAGLYYAIAAACQRPLIRSLIPAMLQSLIRAKRDEPAVCLNFQRRCGWHDQELDSQRRVCRHCICRLRLHNGHAGICPQVAYPAHAAANLS